MFLILEEVSAQLFLRLKQFVLEIHVADLRGLQCLYLGKLFLAKVVFLALLEGSEVVLVKALDTGSSGWAKLPVVPIVTGQHPATKPEQPLDQRVSLVVVV